METFRPLNFFLSLLFTCLACGIVGGVQNWYEGDDPVKSGQSGLAAGVTAVVVAYLSYILFGVVLGG